MVEAGCITAAAQRGHLGSLAPVFGLQWRGAPGLLGELVLLPHLSHSPTSLCFFSCDCLGPSSDVGQKLVSHPWGTGASSYLLLRIPTTNWCWGLDETDEGETASPLWHCPQSSSVLTPPPRRPSDHLPDHLDDVGRDRLGQRPTPTAERQLLFLSSLHQTSHRESAPSCADRPSLRPCSLCLCPVDRALARDEFLPSRATSKRTRLAWKECPLADCPRHTKTASSFPSRTRLEQLEPGPVR